MPDSIIASRLIRNLERIIQNRRTMPAAYVRIATEALYRELDQYFNEVASKRATPDYLRIVELLGELAKDQPSAA